MNRAQKMNFQTFYGFKELIITKRVMQDRLSELYLWTESFPRKNDKNEVRLLDTFFSDTFPKNLLSKMVSGTSKNTNIKILVLNPNSHLAESRAKALKDANATEEINKALYFVLDELFSIQNKENELSSRFHRNKKKFEFISEQLDLINSFKYNLEIRFYSVLTQVPVYLISEFVAVGQVLYNSSAALNPWMIFVDDENQDNDIYDRLSRNFDRIWDISENYPSRIVAPSGVVKNVFISFGHDEAILKIVEGAVKRNNFKPITYKKIMDAGKSVIEKVESMTSNCSTAIIVMTKDDIECRPRQNVVHELGWCQALYRRSNVLVLVEEGLEMPSNISGLVVTLFNRSNMTELEKSIDQFLQQYKK